MEEDTHHLPKSSNPETLKAKGDFFRPLHGLICSSENEIQKQNLGRWGDTLIFFQPNSNFAFIL